MNRSRSFDYFVMLSCFVTLYKIGWRIPGLERKITNKKKVDIRKFYRHSLYVLYCIEYQILDSKKNNFAAFQFKMRDKIRNDIFDGKFHV